MLTGTGTPIVFLVVQDSNRMYVTTTKDFDSNSFVLASNTWF